MGGRLKELLEKSLKFHGLVIVAVYLLPRGASLEDIKNFATEFIGESSEWAENDGLIRARDSLVKQGFLYCKDGPEPAVGMKEANLAHYPDTRFVHSLPELHNHEVFMHSPGKMARFACQFQYTKMNPKKPTRQRKGNSFVTRTVAARKKVASRKNVAVRKKVATEKAIGIQQCQLFPVKSMQDEMKKEEETKSEAEFKANDGMEAEKGIKTEMLPEADFQTENDLKAEDGMDAVKQEVVVKVEAVTNYDEPIELDEFAAARLRLIIRT